ncbi:hypothetical protein [Pseudomonas sp. BMS12]|uniref:hypothetical protein n=1 Tax=Pseudomonas sp. BMS12 TaxID=1796033 RepID=UPI000ABFFE77|nr:hypothetical protein [Pseudomonas sp. BMS12]
MMNKPANASALSTQSNTAVQTVQVASKRKVTYLFKFTSSSNLSLPYAMAVNGTVTDPTSGKPKRLTHNKAKTFTVDENAAVTLYLNSDAQVSFREEPVYAITPTTRDVHITITEKTGKHSDQTTPVFKETKKGSDGKEVDYYTADLTGDVWLKVSHKYTEAEAKSRIPAGTDSAIQDAVLNVYRGLSTAQVTATFAATASKAAQSITMSFDASNNASSNISTFSLLSDGLPRTHPKGLIALFRAAQLAGVSKLTLSSAWRPMLGSIAHRSGLGLDINYMEAGDKKIRVNREELRKSAPDLDWVSAEEKTLFSTYEQAQKDAASAAKEQKAAAAALKKAQKEPDKIVDAQKAKDAADKKKTDADKAKVDAEKAWNDERDRNEPAGLRSFRESLQGNSLVSQLFDPWYMDSNTRDQVAATANKQASANEKLHAHHLHLTVSEPELL